jgi:hypothetical protein
MVRGTQPRKSRVLTGGWVGPDEEPILGQGFG